MSQNYVGKDMKVTLGANKISLMGTVSLSGVTTDFLEISQFGDSYKSYAAGMKDSGDITFSGLADFTDTNGQTALRNYNAANTSVTDIRVYVDSVSYWIPSTTNPLSSVFISTWDIGGDMGGNVTASFTAKVSGKLILV